MLAQLLCCVEADRMRYMRLQNRLSITDLM
jgi:hypothetical protein